MRIGLGIGLINKSTTGSVTIPPVVSSVTIPTSIVVNTPIAVSYTIVGPTTTITRTWYRGVTIISTSTTSDLYTPVQADAGNASNIKCVVTATNAAGSSSADSNTVAQVLTARTGAFLTASAISDATIRGGLNTFDIGLIANSLDTKMYALYPFVSDGATSNDRALQHRWNFMDARNLDAAYRLQFTGGDTHNSNGYTPNGTNAYANTFFQPSLGWTNTNSVSFGVYTRNNTATAAVMGSATNVSTVPDASFLYTNLSGNLLYAATTTGAHSSISSIGATPGLFVVSRTASNLTTVYRNGTSIGSTVKASTNRTTIPFWLGAANFNGYVEYGIGQWAFAFMSDGLNATDATNLYTLTQQLQTTLGRQVGVPIVSDADAQAFLNAAEITNVTQANAVNTLVIGMKAQGLWTKMKAIYPFVSDGATSNDRALQHRFNLKDPRNLDAAFRLTFSGTWVHSNTGALPNGTNAFANTFLSLSNLSQTNTHLSYYSRTATDISGFPSVMGAFGNPNYERAAELYIRRPNQSNNGGGQLGSYLTSQVSFVESSAQRFSIISRTSATSLKYYSNNILRATNTTSDTTGYGNFNIYLGASNGEGVGIPIPYAINFSQLQCAFASIGDGLTDTDATNLYNLTQTFQTTLGRQNP
jgi:hypothetical protein